MFITKTLGNSRRKALQKLRERNENQRLWLFVFELISTCFLFFRISPMGARSTFHIVACGCYLESRMDKAEKAGRSFLDIHIIIILYNTYIYT